MTPLLLSIQQVADLFNCSERHVYELRRRGDLPPPIQLGPRIVRYRRTDLERYVESQAVAESISEPVQLSKSKRRREVTA